MCLVLAPLCAGEGITLLLSQRQGRSSHWETKLRGRSELAQDTRIHAGTRGFMQPHLLRFPRLFPRPRVPGGQGARTPTSIFKRGDSAPAGPGHTQLSGLCSRCSVTAAPSGPPLLSRSLPPAEAGLTWSLFQARRLAHLRP